jgi:hypothetical protein
MALVRGTVNPLNVLGIRKLPYVPLHFARTHTENLKDINNIDNWIYKNLNSRYCIKKTHMVDSKNKISEMCEIAMEDPRELTMLTLGCPYLHKIN